MSKFFEALERAERDEALRRATARPVTERAEPAAAPAEPTLPSAPDSAPTTPPVLRSYRPGEPRSVVRESPDGVDHHLVSLLAPAGFAAEQFRGLRHAVEQWHRATGQSVLAVSSATVRDGKTTTAVNLAGALAQGPDARVLLVEADLRRPVVAEYLSLDDACQTRGLVELIVTPRLPFERAVRECPPFNLAILPAGGHPSAPYEVLKAPGFERVLQEARRRYQYVIIDTPPLLSGPDCRVIAKAVDAFLLVVAAHKTPRGQVEEALALIDPGKLLGIVFNGDDHVTAEYAAPYGTETAIAGLTWWRRLLGGSDRRRRGRRRARTP